ncbi:MAG TPA: acyl-CoA dehydrogenase family protein [Solirubrobacteraceae bacterium]
MTRPDPTPTADELHEYRHRIRDWLAVREPPQISGYWLNHVPALQAWQRVLWEGGLVGVAYPTEFGGRGLTLLHQAICNEELVRRRAPTAIGGPGVDVVAPMLIQFGSRDQCARLLPPLLSGDELWSLGFSEPEAGSDLAAVATTAERDGDEFVLNGCKIWTGFAAFAKRVLVIARTDPAAAKHRGLSCFAVDFDLPGVDRRTLHEMTGESNAPITQFYRVFFNGVRVPADALIGEVNDGWRCVLWSLGRERGPFVMRRQAELEGHFAELLDVIKGRTLTESQVEEIGRLSVLFDALRGQAMRTTRRMAERPGELFPEDSMDKLFYVYVDQQLHHLGLELLGEYGGTRMVTPSGMDAHKYTVNYMYSRAGSIYSGTDQIQKNIVARRKLGLPGA